MKRLALLLIAISLSCVLSLLITDDLDVVQPDRGQRFRIWQSFIHDGGGYRDTTLRVILCTDNLLYESDTLNYKTSNKTITVDITGQQYIKLVCHQTEASVSGNSGILFKNAQFK